MYLSAILEINMFLTDLQTEGSKKKQLVTDYLLHLPFLPNKRLLVLFVRTVVYPPYHRPHPHSG